MASRRPRQVTARATYSGSVMSQPGVKYAVVVAKFNSLITKGLLEGAMEVFESHGVDKSDVDVRAGRGAGQGGGVGWGGTCAGRGAWWGGVYGRCRRASTTGTAAERGIGAW